MKKNTLGRRYLMYIFVTISTNRNYWLLFHTNHHTMYAVSDKYCKHLSTQSTTTVSNLLKITDHIKLLQSDSVCTIDTSIAMCLLYLWHYQSHTNLLFHFISAKLTYCIESNQLKWNAVIFNEKRIDLDLFFRKVTFFLMWRILLKTFLFNATFHLHIYKIKIFSMKKNEVFVIVLYFLRL